MIQEDTFAYAEQRFQELVGSVDVILSDLPAEAFRLMAIYARFECALMRRRRPNGQSPTFSRDQGNQLIILYRDYVNEVVANDFFDRVIAFPVVKHLIQEPPRRRTVENGWVDAQPITDKPSMFKAVKQIRNNLLHGNKFGTLLEGEQDRDILLVKAAAEVLLRAIAEDEELRELFLY